jgi:hypothetical protein
MGDTLVDIASVALVAVEASYKPKKHRHNQKNVGKKK